MKRIWKVSTTVGLCLMLAACGAGEEEPVQEALSFRTALLGAEQCSFTAQVTADYEERSYTFGLDCVYRISEDQAEIVVTEPEAIAGITASVEGENAAVVFDGTALELGILANGQAAPLQLPQLLGQAWTSGYIVSQTAEDEGFLVTYQVGYEEDSLTVYTGFTEEQTPGWAEIYKDGYCILRAELTDFSF